MLPSFHLPLPAADFLSRYWQKRPLLMRGAAAGLDHPDPSMLAGLSLEEQVESRLITGSGQGPWNLQHGPFTEQDFQVLPRENWTLLVQSVDHFLTEVSLLLDHFDFLPGWRLEDIMISYAARGGSVGPHFDRYDVFLIQARGRRRWQIGGQCGPDTPLQPHDQLRLLAAMPVEEEYVLEPGDVLYLPPGVGHWGIAEDSECVTWSVGFRAPAPTDVLDRLADTLQEHAAGLDLYTDPRRQPPADVSLLSSADLDDLVRQTLETLTPNLRRQALAALLSEPRQPAGLDFEIDCEHIAAAAPQAVLVRHGAARLLLDDTGDVWLNGDRWRLSDESRPLARLLAARRLYTDDDLEPLMTEEGQDLLDEWTDAGYFQWLA